tara:strand:+ start:208 stop:600 length:393 start_codon:yes stop_codon:yes gene_type:complete
MNKIKKNDLEWKEILSSEEYDVLRKKGTELPYSGFFNNHFESGIYSCKGCGNELYKSENKFDSGCGWPSYDKCIDNSIEYIKDTSLKKNRTEILCAKCGGHQGHVFDDGHTSTGKRYCVNSASINFNLEK